MAYDFPNSPSNGALYVSSSGLYIYSNDTSWHMSAQALGALSPYSNIFRYRSIYTRGYTAAGYKNASPWANVNKTVHSTDITTNLGDLLTRSGAYLDGGYSDYIQYVYGLANSYSASETYCSSVNMQTETGRTYNSAYNLKTARVNHVAIMTPDLSAAYITAGNTGATDKHDYVTETMYVVGTGPANPSVSGTSTKMLGELRGWVIGSGCGAHMLYATETWTNFGTFNGTDGYSKVMSSKWGYGYGKSGTNTATTAVSKYNDYTGSSLGVVCYSADNGGEENMQTGQNYGYQLGNYNGAQNTNAYKISFVNDTLTTGGSDMQPKGHDGMSSGCCASASATVLGGD
jgi:hypothetical protein